MAGQAHFEVYPQTRDVTDPEVPENKLTEPTGQFGWRFQSANGKISAIGGEGFTRRGDANRAIHDLLSELAGVEPHPPILDVDE